VTVPEGSEQRLVISNPGSAPMNFTVACADAADPSAAPLMLAALPSWLEVVPVRGTVPAKGQLALRVRNLLACWPGWPAGRGSRSCQLAVWQRLRATHSASP
jgi:hypothetical protein